jgi:hypothetical protein
VPAGELKKCEAEHHSGANLPACMKVYVPAPAGPWRIVFEVVRFDDRYRLEYVASGLGHTPREGRRLDVYKLAHYRLHGAWPRR